MRVHRGKPSLPMVAAQLAEAHVPHHNDAGVILFLPLFASCLAGRCSWDHLSPPPAADRKSVTQTDRNAVTSKADRRCTPSRGRRVPGSSLIAGGGAWASIPAVVQRGSFGADGTSLRGRIVATVFTRSCRRSAAWFRVKNGRLRPVR